MSNSPSRAFAHADARRLARPDFLERHLSRYRSELQPAAHILARRHARLAELSVSFPALFAALALPRPRFDPEPVIGGVIGGASLAGLAEAACVPLWLRKMSPESFREPVPALPDSLFLRRRIANHLPRRAAHAPVWLEIVADAVEIGSEPFMVWCARLAQGGRKNALKRQNLLGLWAWYSSRPDTRGFALMQRVWSPDMELKAALAGADLWLKAVSLELELGEERLTDLWLEPGSADGYDFVPLACARDVAAEAAAMENCLRTYGYDLTHGYSRLWGVREQGRAVATLCVAWRGPDALPVVARLELARNQRAPARMWHAAHKWLVAQDLSRLDRGQRSWPDVPLNRAAWQSLWRPYWLEKRRFPAWLPLAPSRPALDAL